MIKNLIADFKPSIVVFLVALPLCLGIALASQAPLSSGILAGIVGGIVIGLLSDSQLSVSGPAAGLTVIVAQSIHELGDFKLFAISVFLSGLIQILFSIARGGNIGNYFPTSVIKGMLSAIGLILVLKQIPHAFGYHTDYMGDEAFVENADENTFSALLHALNSLNKGCITLALMSFAIIFLWDKYSTKSKSEVVKSIPSALLAVVCGTVINYFFLNGTLFSIDERHLVAIPFTGGITHFLSQISFPDWSGLTRPAVYSVAILIAIVGSIETLLSTDAADKIDPQKRSTSKNKELFAQGIGNSISGLIGGLPITAVIVRTSANVNAGAKSRNSAVLHGVWLLLMVLMVPALINLIPLPVLAVVLILVGFKLTSPEIYFKMYQAGFDQFVPFIVTIAAILFTDLLKGIAIGLFVGFLFVIKRGVYRSIVMVHDDEKYYLIRFMKDISFFEKNKLMHLLSKIPEGSEVTIDGSNNVHVDVDIVGVIEDFIESARNKNIKVEIKKSTVALSPFFQNRTIKEN